MTTDQKPGSHDRDDAASAVLTRLSEAINARDIEALVNCFAADFASDTPTTPDNSFTGTAQVRANWQAIFDRTPDLAFEVLRTVEDGSSVWAEIRQQGTSRPAVRSRPGVSSSPNLRGLDASQRAVREPGGAGSCGVPQADRRTGLTRSPGTERRGLVTSWIRRDQSPDVVYAPLTSSGAR
jgi:hypothetical protein